MLRHRVIAVLMLCCFAVASALPGFAAVLPVKDGTISIVICSGDGFKTIEVEDEDQSEADETQHLCDVCQIHCGIGPTVQLPGWAFPHEQGRAQTTQPDDLQTPLLVAGDPKLPRGPPETAFRPSRRI